MIRWGVAGPGSIAASFAEAVTLEPHGTIVAVASRSVERAEAFGERFAIPRRYGDYDDLAADDDVDAVYIATPHSRHEADALRYLAAGKHVLCEKPMALNAAQVQRMVTAAAASGRFLMEAISSRCLPAYRALVDIVGSGQIGEPLHVHGDFGFRMPFDATHRLFDPQQGGGALLDLGIYPIQLCTLVLGPVAVPVGAGAVGETGVDESIGAVLRHDGGGIGIVEASIRANLPCTARISGTDGHIDLPAFMSCPDSLTVTTGSSSKRIELPYEHLLHFEIAEAHRCIAAGLPESPDVSWAESVALAEVMDAIRSQIGVAYPGE